MKYCDKCRFFDTPYGSMCLHPELRDTTDPLGERIGNPDRLRKPGGKCGPEAKFWAPIPSLCDRIMAWMPEVDRGRLRKALKAARTGLMVGLSAIGVCAVFMVAVFAMGFVGYAIFGEGGAVLLTLVSSILFFAALANGLVAYFD